MSKDFIRAKLGKYITKRPDPKTGEPVDVILLESGYDTVLGCYYEGYVTLSRFIELFGEAINEHLKTGRDLKECLDEADDVYDDKGNKIGEKGYKRFFRKWREEGLI